MIPSICRPLSRTSRTTGVLLAMHCSHGLVHKGYPRLRPRQTSMSASTKIWKRCQYAHVTLNTNKGNLPWHLVDPRDLDEAPRYLPRSIHEASKGWSFGVGAGALQTSKQGYLLFCFFVPSAVSLMVHGAICKYNHRDTGLYTLVSGPLVYAPRHQSPGHLDNQNHIGWHVLWRALPGTKSCRMNPACTSVRAPTLLCNERNANQ